MLTYRRQPYSNQSTKKLQKIPYQHYGSDIRKKIQNYSFSMDDVIGKGYSSTVYKGTNDITGNIVAIKVIDLKSLKDRIARQMLQTEIQCFKETNHRNLLAYENSFFTSNNCYIMTEYCSGGDLAKLIKQKNGFSQKEVQKIFHQIFQGYWNLYYAGFVHRDLKPANIFISSNNEFKIADFGFSKRRNSIEKQHYNVGTPIYMPVQSLTSNIYNEKTEVWALGIILYQLTFGHVPFRGANQQDLIKEIEKGNIHFPENKVLQPALKDFICRCLHKNPQNRMTLQQMKHHKWMQQSMFCQQFRQLDIRQNLLQNQDQQSSKIFKQQTFNKSVQLIPKAKVSFSNSGLAPSKQSMDQISTSTSTESTKLKTQTELKQNPMRTAFEKIITLINCFRHLYASIQNGFKLAEESLHEEMRSKIKNINRSLIIILKKMMNTHIHCVESKKNEFQFQQSIWRSFTLSDQWKLYACSIKKYSEKYQHSTKDISLSDDNLYDLVDGFIELYQTFNEFRDSNLLLLRQRYALLEFLHHVSTLITIKDRIKQEGWNRFSEQNKEIPQAIRIDVGNYYQILEEVKAQYELFVKTKRNDYL